MDLIGKLPEYGLLGLLLAISLGALAWAVNRINKIADERLGDWRAVSEVMTQQRQVSADFVSTSADRTRAQERMAHALEVSAASQQALASSQQALASEIGRLRESIEGQRTELVRFREEYLRRTN